MRSLPYLVLVDDDEEQLPLMNLELGEDFLAVDGSAVLPGVLPGGFASFTGPNRSSPLADEQTAPAD